MFRLSKGRFAARLATSPEEIAAAQALRYRVFRALAGEDGLDVDSYDSECLHVLVEDTCDDKVVCCFRLLELCNGSEIARSYSAQFYDLSGLVGFRDPMAEMGRFCIDPDYANDPDILRIAWGAMTHYVDANAIKMLFGCSSFAGTDAEKYRDAFALLQQNHLGPQHWLPDVKAHHAVRFVRVAGADPDARRALKAIPPLLRTYLLMGGWVSDHAVVDHDLNTLHVFTGLEISSILPERARILRAVAR